MASVGNQESYDYTVLLPELLLHTYHSVEPNMVDCAAILLFYCGYAIYTFCTISVNLPSVARFSLSVDYFCFALGTKCNTCVSYCSRPAMSNQNCLLSISSLMLTVGHSCHG